ncbi:MAG: hypothetical protein Ct9H300mP1_34840 [Planctomycetaceae bacterium]|nr:MAG: hypothetical protein Ct9H300mP1_34840 [Planctomycetaceae bacterium]
MFQLALWSPTLGASGLASGPKYRSETSGSVPELVIVTPAGGGRSRDEHLVVGHLPKRIIAGVCNFSEPMVPFTLDGDPAVRPRVGDRATGAGVDGQFLGREQLPSVHGAVDDPAVDVALAGRVSDRNGLQVMVVLEVGIHVLVPVECVDQVLDVIVEFLGEVLGQQRARYLAALDQDWYIPNTSLPHWGS